MLEKIVHIENIGRFRNDFGSRGAVLPPLLLGEMQLKIVEKPGEVNAMASPMQVREDVLLYGQRPT